MKILKPWKFSKKITRKERKVNEQEKININNSSELNFSWLKDPPQRKTKNLARKTTTIRKVNIISYSHSLKITINISPMHIHKKEKNLHINIAKKLLNDDHEINMKKNNHKIFHRKNRLNFFKLKRARN